MPSESPLCVWAVAGVNLSFGWVSTPLANPYLPSNLTFASQGPDMDSTLAGNDRSGIRILVVTGIFPPDAGGPATYVPILAQALQRRGHHLSVLTTSEPEHLGNDDSIFPFQVTRINRRTSVLRRALAVIRYILRLGRQADVVYANGMFLETAFANLLLRQPLVVKVVGDEAWERAVRLGWSRHGYVAFQRQARSGFRVRILKILRSWSIRRADRVVVPSHYLAGWVREWGAAADKIATIQNAAQIPNGLPRIQLDLPAGTRVVTVGRLVRWKQVAKIIRVIADLEGLALVVVGDGDEKPALRRLAADLGLAGRVVFAGQRSQAETLAILASCHIFVLFSTYEGLPHVVLEAMSQGIPVVASRVGGVPEIVEDGVNGLLVQPRSCPELKQALMRLAGDRIEREKLAKAARRTARKLGVRRMVDQAEALLIQAAGQRRPPSVPPSEVPPGSSQ